MNIMVMIIVMSFILMETCPNMFRQLPSPPEPEDFLFYKQLQYKFSKIIFLDNLSCASGDEFKLDAWIQSGRF